MTVIQSAPWKRNRLLMIAVSAALGVLLGGLFRGLFGESLTWGANLLVVIGWMLVAFAILVGSLTIAYPTVAFDPGTRTVRFGRRTVPIDSVRSATRSVGVSPRSANLIYRFESTEGAAARVLVVGRPFKGLDEAGRAALDEFVRLAPIRLDDPDEAKRQALASNLVGDSKRTPVSAEFIAEELAAFDAADAGQQVAAPETPESGAGATDGTRAGAAGEDELLAMRQDDEEAARRIAASPAAARVVRRIAGIILWVAVAGTIVLGVIALITMATSGDDRLDDSALPVILTVVLTFAIAGPTWFISADLDVGQRRRMGLAWLEAAGDEQRRRGLPTPFAAAWTEPAPGHRSLGAAAFAGGVIGLLALLSGLLLVFDEVGSPIAPAGSFGVLAFGIVLSALAIWGWVRYRRRRRADAAWVVGALGRRVQ